MLDTLPVTQPSSLIRFFLKGQLSALGKMCVHESGNYNLKTGRTDSLKERDVLSYPTQHPRLDSRFSPSCN